MAGNPKESRWYATPRSERKRRGLELTLSDEAFEGLSELAESAGVSRSKLVEQWILAKRKRKS